MVQLFAVRIYFSYVCCNYQIALQFRIVAMFEIIDMQMIFHKEFPDLLNVSCLQTFIKV